ncbi:SAM-dependent methyltransferase, partial [Burkholderia multivorans]
MQGERVYFGLFASVPDMSPASTPTGRPANDARRLR